MMTPNTPLTAQIEPFDSFWEAPKNIEKGYSSFSKFYRRNYVKHLPKDRNATVLIISCGPGYFANLLKNEGYKEVLGIDSDPAKIQYAKRRGLNCRVDNAFSCLKENKEAFDMIVAEQEINHLTKDEILEFLRLCRASLKRGGMLVLHSLNGANPLTGAEAIAQNFNHYNSFTENSLRQVLSYSNFDEIRVIPLKLYVFYENPLNYAGMILDILLTILFRLSFMYYGKSNRIFSKKIAALCKKPH